jgi:hypothetical protein
MSETKVKRVLTVDKELKEVELQLKKLELREKELELKLKDVETREKEASIKNETDRLDNTKSNLLVSQLYILNWMLESAVIDEEKSIIGSEPKLMRTYDDDEIDIIKDKVFKILNKM